MSDRKLSDDIHEWMMCWIAPLDKFNACGAIATFRDRAAALETDVADLRARAAIQAIRAELRAIRNDYRVAFGAGPRPWYTWAWQILLTPLLAAVMLLFLGGLVMVDMAWDVKTRGNE